MMLAFLLQLAPAQPQPPATIVVEPVAMAVVAWDADGDGRTSRAELIAGIRRGFAAPTGYIGFVDWAERRLGDGDTLASPFDVDTDRDGQVTRAETLTIRATTGGPGERVRGRAADARPRP